MGINIRNLQEVHQYNSNRKIAKFHMPGNYGGEGLHSHFKKNMALYDTTEVVDMDDYHSPEGIIKELEISISKMFKSNSSISLVNGSTSGIIAAISYCFKEGDEVLISRDCHKSVISGLIVSGATPVLADNEFDRELGIYLPLKIETIKKKLESNSKIKGIVLTSPNYYGIGYKDLQKIVSLCHEHGRTLIVDEAHGSHLYFTNHKDYLANSCKADIVINSFHKSLTGLTQTGCISLNSKKLSIDTLRRHVSLVTTTSPSYILLASMAFSTEQFRKDGLIMLQDTIKKSSLMKELLNKYKIRYIKECHLDSDLYLDPTKITIVLDSNEIAEKIFNELQGMEILPEMIVDNKILFIVNKEISYRQIVKTVLAIKKHCSVIIKGKEKLNYPFDFIAKQVITPREAFYAPKEKIPLEEAIGSIATESITPYPPGVPIVIPGQEISKEVISYLNSNTGRIHGLKNGMIEVVNKRERD